MRMRRIARTSLVGRTSYQHVFLLRHFLDPNIYNLLQAACSQICKRCVLPQFIGAGSLGGLGHVRMEFETLAELFRETCKLVVFRESAQNYENLLPILEVGVLNDVIEIFRHDRLEEAQIGEADRALREVSLLRALQKLWTAFNRQENGIGEAFCGEAKLDCRLEITENEGFCYKLINI
jgi:hypothetical protein